MQKDRSNFGARGQPFPQAKQTKAQRDEDIFMQEHAGLGSRLIYRMVQAFSCGDHRQLKDLMLSPQKKPRTSDDQNQGQ